MDAILIWRCLQLPKCIEAKPSRQSLSTHNGLEVLLGCRLDGADVSRLRKYVPALRQVFSVIGIGGQEYLSSRGEVWSKQRFDVNDW